MWVLLDLNYVMPRYAEIQRRRHRADKGYKLKGVFQDPEKHVRIKICNMQNERINESMITIISYLRSIIKD